MPTLEVQNLTKRYRGVEVVDHVNFTICGGEVTGYLGPNGAGKSTTVRMLTGLVEPTSGKILFDDDLRRAGPCFSAAESVLKNV